ncbi:hypothetical protein SCHPADRAFT_923568 [Schizopora paradoxa]|uniref:Protein sym1 n=1 Tax=Schizopora paradoxa TaxID=27342 RepID=A0A0H2S9A4_9AGAM|nr:hypothetical protein SCHPADRAFT_923568 [Schizopora paradoxa]
MASITLAARAYQKSFDVRPYTTLAVTNGTLSAIGDAVAQGTQILSAVPGKHDDRPHYDPLRSIRFFAFGAGMGPIIGRWNQFLEKQFPLRSLTNIAPLAAGVKIGGGAGAVQAAPIGIGQVSGMAVAKRVAADQLFMAPIGLAIFIGSMGAMEGRSGAQISEKYADLYKPAILANWQVWPLAQVVNFRYMPLAYRVPFQSTCGIFWNLYLSLLNSSKNTEHSEEDTMRKTLG